MYLCIKYKKNNQILIKKTKNMNRLWEDFPLELKLSFLNEQERQGNKRSAKVFIDNIYASNKDGGFQWSNSKFLTKDTIDYIEGHLGAYYSFIDIKKFYVTAQEVIQRFPYIKQYIEYDCAKSGSIEQYKNYERFSSLFSCDTNILGKSLYIYLATRQWCKVKKEIKKLFEDKKSRFYTFTSEKLNKQDYQKLLHSTYNTEELFEKGYSKNKSEQNSKETLKFLKKNKKNKDLTKYLLTF